MSKRAAIYGRVSSDEQTKGFSIPTQMAKMRQYAELHGFTVTHEFAEDYTATKLNRPELDKVRNLVRHGEIDALIVYASDRLTRDRVHGPILRDELVDAGVELHFVTRGKYESTPEGEMFAGIEDNFNAYWRAKMLESAARGRRGKAEAGILPGDGTLPYGYDKTGKRREMRAVIMEEQAKIVRNIFTWFVHEGLSVEKITGRLTERRIPTPGGPNHGRRKAGLHEWHPNTVLKILRQEAYSGTLYVYKYRKLKNGQRHILRPREEWIPISVPVIVERELWEAAQQKLDEGRRKYIKPPKHEYLMSRRIKCMCGQHASARPHYAKGTPHLYYRCNATYRNTRDHTCDMPMFRAKLVDGAVWDWVHRLLIDPQALIAGYQESQRKLDQQNDRVREEIAAVDRQIEKQQHKLAQLLDLYLEGEFSKAMLEQKRTELEAQLTALHEERQHLMDRIAHTTITDEHIKSITEVAANVRDKLGSADFALKRQLIEALNIWVTLAVEDGQKVVYLNWYAQEDRLCIQSKPTNDRSWQRTPPCP